MRLDKRQGESSKAHADSLNKIRGLAYDEQNALFRDLTERMEITQQMVNDMAEERDQIVLAAYREPGATLDTVGERFGVHATRIGRLVQRAKEKEKARGIAQRGQAQAE